jgi:CDP-glucose 4,6-dehydratase
VLHEQSEVGGGLNVISPDFWRGKRVFITGHTGFKGSWLCKLLLALGAEATGYALAPNTDPSLWDICGLDAKVESHIGDIRDIGKLRSAFAAAKPEIVFHLAAQPLVIESYNVPRYTYEVNVMGTVNLLECIRAADCVKSFVNVTTDKVYLNRESGEDYREDEELNGYDPYSNSKSCSELVTSSYINSFFRDKNKIPVSTARSGNVIGGGDFAENRIIPDCAKETAAGKPIGIRNPSSVRPYQFVLDTLTAYLSIAEKQFANPELAGAYNIAPDAAANNGALATLFCDAWGNGASWKHTSAEQPHEAKLLGLNCDKIKSALGWQPRYGIAQAVALSAEWYREHYSGGNANVIMRQQIQECISDGK